MKNKIVSTIAAALSVALVSNIAAAAPADDEYKKVRRGRTLTLSSCALVEGVSKVLINENGNQVSLPPAQKRDAEKLGAKYKFFACGLNDQSQVALFAKSTVDAAPQEFTFVLADFKKSQGNYGCSNLKGWPGSHIYKTIGSNHFTDIRRNTIGVIIKPGGSGPFPSCLQAKDQKGNVVANLGLYAKGAGWAARYYAGIGCGSGTPLNGSGVASRARSKTGNSNVAFDFGSVCYGPINASQCIGSAQC